MKIKIGDIYQRNPKSGLEYYVKIIQIYKLHNLCIYKYLVPYYISFLGESSINKFNKLFIKRNFTTIQYLTKFVNKEE